MNSNWIRDPTQINIPNRHSINMAEERRNRNSMLNIPDSKSFRNPNKPKTVMDHYKNLTFILPKQDRISVDML